MPKPQEIFEVAIRSVRGSTANTSLTVQYFVVVLQFLLSVRGCSSPNEVASGQQRWLDVMADYEPPPGSWLHKSWKAAVGDPLGYLGLGDHSPRLAEESLKVELCRARSGLERLLSVYGNHSLPGQSFTEWLESDPTGSSTEIIFRKDIVLWQDRLQEWGEPMLAASHHRRTRQLEWKGWSEDGVETVLKLISFTRRTGAHLDIVRDVLNVCASPAVLSEFNFKRAPTIAWAVSSPVWSEQVVNGVRMTDLEAQLTELLFWDREELASAELLLIRILLTPSLQQLGIAIFHQLVWWFAGSLHWVRNRTVGRVRLPGEKKQAAREDFWTAFSGLCTRLEELGLCRSWDSLLPMVQSVTGLPQSLSKRPGPGVMPIALLHVLFPGNLSIFRTTLSPPPTIPFHVYDNTPVALDHKGKTLARALEDNAVQVDDRLRELIDSNPATNRFHHLLWGPSSQARQPDRETTKLRWWALRDAVAELISACADPASGYGCYCCGASVGWGAGQVGTLVPELAELKPPPELELELLDLDPVQHCVLERLRQPFSEEAEYRGQDLWVKAGGHPR
ncbi:hypothetical protein C8R46DRAFT_1038738 [Mycena filopes]|nr:hypothetical protein C8R46DRAFT_1038738 [Mycena filopes]